MLYIVAQSMLRALLLIHVKNKVIKCSHHEEEDAIRHSAPSAAVVFEGVRHEAVDELARNNAVLFWSGLAASLSMGFSFISEALLQSGLAGTPWCPLILKFGYTIGFMIVILGRQKMFTENTRTPVIHVLRERRWAALWNALRLWGVVPAANVLGTMVLGVGLYLADLFNATQNAAMTELAGHVITGVFRDTFLSAILAGWLIALIVWVLPVGETARAAVIIIITYIVGLGGFSYVIAGSTLAFYALATDVATPAMVLGNFFLPALLGNIIGGVAFVAALNYAQVLPDD